MNTSSTIAIVDDDPFIRESLEGLLKSMDFSVRTYPSAESFLNCTRRNGICCLILDVRMPAMSGPELQQKLNAERSPVSIIFITAHGDARMRVRLLQEGAIECLYKPFSEEALLNAVNLALSR